MKNLIHSEMIVATKARKDVAKNILKVILSEISSQELAKPLINEDIIKIIRKVIQGIDETLKYLQQNCGNYLKLIEEKQVLETFLPTCLTEEEIRQELEIDKLKQCKSEGQAIGMAIKQLKEKNKVFLGETVSKLIKVIFNETI